VEVTVPRDHTGQGTLLIGEQELGVVTFAIAEEQTRGWNVVRGTLKGEPEILAEAFDEGRVSLRHDATGFVMKLLMADMPCEGVANVTVDVSDRTTDKEHQA
jgi:hypothetical protein